MAGELLKDPYNFEFLALAEDAEERALQKGLLGHIQRFLIS
ncbi:MAG: PDDEXK nuclease domain-containing protein [Isosphaeraceae bacterium]